MKNLGKAVNKIRMDKGMSVAELAKATGQSETYIYGLESGEIRMFSDEILSKLCEAFRVNKVALIGLSMSDNEKIYEESFSFFMEHTPIFGANKSGFVGYLAVGDYQTVSQQVVQAFNFEETEPIIIPKEPRQ